MTTTDVWLVSIAVLLVVVAGVTASAEAALSSFSKVRAAELLAAGRRGAARLVEVTEDSPRYLNTVLLFRKAAETTAIVLVALVVADAFASWWQRILVAAGAMVVVSYVVRRRGAAHPGSPARRAGRAALGRPRGGC